MISSNCKRWLIVGCTSALLCLASSAGAVIFTNRTLSSATEDPRHAFAIDLDGDSTRSLQGSMRQFIKNSNAISGVNKSWFQ